MKVMSQIASFLVLLTGIALLAFGISRYRLPYEDGRFFDSEQGVVYHVQTAEFCVVAGGLVTGLSLLALVLLFRQGRGRARV